MLLEEIKNINSGKKQLKEFALTIGIVLLIVSAIMFYNSSELKLHFGIAGILVILLGYVFPNLLMPLQKLWMALALVLGFFMSRLILTLLFYLVITPIGLISKLAGKDFLDLKLTRTKETFWNYREKKEYQKIDSERQF